VSAAPPSTHQSFGPLSVGPSTVPTVDGTGYPLRHRADGSVVRTPPEECPNGHPLRYPNVLVSFSPGKHMLGWLCLTCGMKVWGTALRRRKRCRASTDTAAVEGDGADHSHRRPYWPRPGSGTLTRAWHCPDVQGNDLRRLISSVVVTPTEQTASPDSHPRPRDSAGRT
jgi:hypothetical protein